MAGKANGGGSMLTVSAGIGQGVKIHNTDLTVLHGTHPQGDLHFVAGRTGDLGFLTGVDDSCGSAGLHGNEGRIHIAHRRLLGAEAAADPGFFHADLALGNAQRPGQNTAGVEDNLGGGRL